MIEMLKDGSVVLVCRRNVEGRSIRGYRDTVLDIKTVPDWFDFKVSAFDTDYEGKEFNRESHRKDGEGSGEFFDRLRHIDHIRHSCILLYVVADGLPLRAVKAVNSGSRTGSASSQAERILERMKER